MLKRVVLLPLAFVASPVSAQVEGFSAVTQVSQGAPFLMTYQGTLTGNESFGFTLRGSDALIYDRFGNTDGRPDEQPVKLYAPDTPGEYDAVIQVDYEIRWRLPVTVTPATVFLSAPAAARPGEWVDVTWTGPGGFDDRIRIARPGDPDDVELTSSIVGDDSPSSTRMPDEEGTFELRYVMGSEPEAAVLGRTSIVVGVAAAYEQALADAGGLVDLLLPSEVQAGAEVEVGFGNLSSNWMVQFVYPGEDRFLDGQGGTFSYLVSNPMRIDAPMEPGRYEVIALDPDRLVRARYAVTVVPATATLAIASDNPALSNVEVNWTGPGSSFDRIGFARVGAAAADLVPLSITYVGGSGSPVLVARPREPGAYELRYLQSLGGEMKVLATLPYTVR